MSENVGAQQLQHEGSSNNSICIVHTWPSMTQDYQCCACGGTVLSPAKSDTIQLCCVSLHGGGGHVAVDDEMVVVQLYRYTALIYNWPKQVHVNEPDKS